MSAAKPIEFGGTDDELEKYLLEFARRTGGWAARDKKRGGILLSSGALLSPNPNTLPLQIRVTREEGKVFLRTVTVAFPWTRAKKSRIAAFREGQLADYLTARIRGSAPEKFDALRLREPFATYGRDVQSISASFAWAVAGGLAALAAAFVAATLASYPLLSLVTGEIVERAAAIEQAGTAALPSAAERASIGFGFRLGASMVFAFPLAFFAALLHTCALTAADLWRRADRLPMASFLFLAIFLSMSFFAFRPVLAIPMAILVPLGTHLGHTFVWARRRERVREGPRPRKVVIAVAVVLAASLAGTIAPARVDARERNDRLALFRDRLLLGPAPGKAIATTYYKYTLYGADPLKEFFTTDPLRAQRSQRIALCSDPARAALYRSLDFTVATGGVHDVGDRGHALVRVREEVPVANPPDRNELARALDELSRRTFRGGILRHSYGLAWSAVYYAGPVAAVLVFVGICCPGIAIMFRALHPRTAAIALAACVLSTGLLMLYGESRLQEVSDVMEGLRGDPRADRIAAGLAHPSPVVRHEAAYRASLLKDTAPLAEALLKTADDPDLRVRLWACAALGKSGDARALDRLIARLDDRELFVRYRAAEGLGFLKHPGAVPPLLRMMRDRSWYEGLYALQALRRIEPEKF